MHVSMNKHLLPLFVVASACGSSDDDPPPPPSPIKSIVLVHGAFADGSSWDRVTPLLQEEGFRVIAVQLPLSSLAEDVAATRRAIDIAPGPVLLVAHSYGGFVITEAGNTEKVMGLVYLAGFAPDDGESINDVYEGWPPPEWTKTAEIDSGGFAWLPRETVATLFAQDLPSDDIDALTSKQKPISLSIFDDAVTTAAWRARPSTFVRAAQDGIIDPALQQQMATRAGSTLTTMDSSHVVMLSHPDETAAVILQAARPE
jgi:pimeloyl-ACP methyl ester carboxylesterase